MAIRLARNVKAEEKPKNGFDLTASEGKEYNLDEIEKLKNRKASDTELVIENLDKDAIHSVGDIAIAKKCEDLNISSLDYKKYLLGEEKSTKGYTPTISLRRPIVIWEDGETKDTRSIDEMDSLYKEIEDIRLEMKGFKSKISDVISDDKKEYIPTVGAVINYVEEKHNINIKLENEGLYCGDRFSISNEMLYVPDELKITDGSLIIGG